MTISKRELNAFLLRLNLEDRSPGTIGKYLHDAGKFSAWLGRRELTRETAARWRDHLRVLHQRRQPLGWCPAYPEHG